MVTSNNKKTEQFSDEFKRAFRFFYEEVKKYKDKHYGVEVFPPSYADIGDYITGHLSTDGELDLDWLFNERDLTLFSEEVQDEILTYCQKKIFDEKKNYVDDDETFSLW